MSHVSTHFTAAAGQAKAAKLNSSFFLPSNTRGAVTCCTSLLANAHHARRCASYAAMQPQHMLNLSWLHMPACFVHGVRLTGTKKLFCCCLNLQVLTTFEKAGCDYEHVSDKCSAIHEENDQLAAAQQSGRCRSCRRCIQAGSWRRRLRT